jgi:lipoic acid synthetase
VEPATFEEYTKVADRLGFAHAACGPLVRSSYHADQQAHEAGLARITAN